MKTLSDLRALNPDEYIDIISLFFSEVPLTDEEYAIMQEWEDAVYEMYLQEDSHI